MVPLERRSKPGRRPRCPSIPDCRRLRARLRPVRSPGPFWRNGQSNCRRTGQATAPGGHPDETLAVFKQIVYGVVGESVSVLNGLHAFCRRSGRRRCSPGRTTGRLCGPGTAEWSRARRRAPEALPVKPAGAGVHIAEPYPALAVFEDVVHGAAAESVGVGVVGEGGSVAFADGDAVGGGHPYPILAIFEDVVYGPAAESVVAGVVGEGGAVAFADGDAIGRGHPYSALAVFDQVGYPVGGEAVCGGVVVEPLPVQAIDAPFHPVQPEAPGAVLARSMHACWRIGSNRAARRRRFSGGSRIRRSGTGPSSL